MIQTKFRILSVLLFTLCFAVASTASAELSREDRKKIQKEVEGAELYLRVDAPCATGRHPYGVYKRPLVEVSPEGVNTDADDVFTASWWHADSTYWGVSINDPVEVDEVDIEADERTVEIELEGRGPVEDEETVILLVEIDTYDDFRAAFDKAFSRRPLQEEHDDWSAEMKQAVGERRLVAGMNKRQAFYVTGTPERFEKSTEEGKEVEVWHLRQDKGMKTSFFFAKAGEETGLPATIRFEDGVLTDVGGTTGGSEEFSID